jgi:hypothetical protein
MALNEFRSIFLILMVNVRQALLTRRDWALSSISHGGERLYELSRKYPGVSADLIRSSRENLLSYSASLTLSGRGAEARRYLTALYPHPRTGRWWKMWAGNWIPSRALRRFVRTAPELNQA